MKTNARTRFVRWLPALGIAGLLLAGCDTVPLPAPTPLPAPAGAAATPGVPNPASVFCGEQGGKLEIRTAADGSQTGYCIFSNGSECEEWAFFRGECRPGRTAPNPAAPETGGATPAITATMEVSGAVPGAELPNPASVNCEQQGGKLEIRTASDGSQAGVCIFPDGSECDEWAFFRGECKPGEQPAATPAASAVSTDTLVAAVLAQVPEQAYEGIAALPLTVPADSRPLWAVYSTGMRNWDMTPPPSHFVAIYGNGDAGWQELARLDLDPEANPGDPNALLGPDYLAKDGMKQVEIDPQRIWLSVDGGAGAHGGTYQVLSFDGQALRQEVGGTAASPGAGYVADVDGDGQNDVVLNATDPYVFCYACGVRKPGFTVYTWMDGQMLPVGIAAMLMGQQGQPYYNPNSGAVAFAEAGLWPDALAKIAETRKLAGQDDPPTGAGSLRWNEALIKLNHDAYRDAIQDSAYPLLAQVFYGDYDAAVELMRPLGVRQIFSAETPLINGTVAEGWEEALTSAIITSATAALEAKPELASAYFLRGWAEHLANPADPQAQADLRQAAKLASDDPLFAAAAATVRPK